MPYWVVPGKPGTESDLTLAGVADRTLGDSHRWQELFELNKGRTQPDGLVLTDPAQPIRAGWVFILPEGATSGEIRIGPPPTAAPPANQRPDPPSDDQQPATPSAGQQAGAPSAGQPQQAATAGAQPAAVQGGGGTRVLGLPPLVAMLLGVGVLLVAAAALAPLLLRRRRTATVAPPPPSAPPGSRAVLDRAMRQLATQAGHAQVYAALIGADRVSLRLAPALPEAPPPWQARERGAIWDAPSWQLDQGGEGRSGLPLLATVGTVGGELAVVNLGRAPGIVALTGDEASALRVAGAILDDISRDPAAASVAITVVGPPPQLWPHADRIRVTADAREVLPSGDSPADGLRDHLVLVTATLPPSELERLGALAALSGNTAAVLVVGEAPNAAWRFESGPDGSLDVGVLGLDLDRPTPRGRRTLVTRG
ncbi:hypothetical protein D7193_29950 [Micromonospora costi]|uniref:Uncharacterized protein n=1 Tax=Micromonospora costi TaxID=1530042 RepID=A0A3A9ZTG2_9ACTN|nr:hypothetical protein D7193_29950 [Micromonospora costi]